MIIFFTCAITAVAIATMCYMYYHVAHYLHDNLHKLQEELKRARDVVLEALPELKNSQAATWHIDRKTMVMTFEDDYHEKIGMPQQHWNVRDFRKICNSDCLDVFDKWIGQYSLLTDPICRRLRFHITTDEGNTYHWWELIYNLDDTTSKTQHFNGVFINIDHIINVENAIDDARNKMYESELKQTFFASINHDLRTPLNAIAGFANLLSAQYDDLSDEDRNSFADIVETNAETLMKLLSDINSMDCNDIEKMKFKPRNKSVNELTDIVYRTNKVICPSHLKFIFEKNNTEEDKTIYVDPKRIEQVVNNFLSNSFKFTRVGYVKMGWKYIEDSNDVEIYVSDTGMGINEENIGKLFDEYFKVHEHAHGTGLGLNICKKIVDKQNGIIGVESTYGKGSTFYCRFKAVEAA